MIVQTPTRTFQLPRDARSFKATAAGLPFPAGIAAARLCSIAHLNYRRSHSVHDSHDRQPGRAIWPSIIDTPLHPLALPLVLIALAALVGGTLFGGAVLAAIALGGGA